MPFAKNRRIHLIQILISPEIGNREMNDLFLSAWNEHKETDFSYLRKNSLAYICAYQEKKLIGFINIAWDGKKHAFLLDTTVDRRFQHKGVGSKLVRQAIDYAFRIGVEWLHVDYEPALEPFYAACGFRNSKAGIYNLLEHQEEKTI